MSGVLYVMRHGRTVLDNEKRSDGWLDYPLSDQGRIGLINSQQFLKLAPISVVVTCSLRRCAETAHIMASGIMTHPPVGINDKSRTWNLGVLVGTKKKPTKPIVKFFMTHPDEVPEHGESLNAFRKRFQSLLLELMKSVATGKSILLICSGSAIREISLSLTNSRDKLDLDEAGLLTLVPDGKKWKGEVLIGSKQHGPDYWS